MRPLHLYLRINTVAECVIVQFMPWAIKVKTKIIELFPTLMECRAESLPQCVARYVVNPSACSEAVKPVTILKVTGE